MRGRIHRVNRHVRGRSARRGASHHAAVLNARGRPCNVAAGVGLAEVARTRWRSVDVIRHLRAAQGSFRKMLRTAIDRLAVHEGVVGSRGHRMNVVRIGIVEIPVAIDVAVEVANEGVVNIDVAPITYTAVVPGMERFAPT